jgi:hypothetical protein
MTTISALPDAPNPLTDSQAQFNSKALAFTQALPTLVTEINTVSGEMNTAKTNAETAETNAAASETNAAASETNAAASAAAAGNAASAAAFAAGTYALNDAAISQVDFQTYRKITASSYCSTDPAADPTNWAALGWLRTVTVTGATHTAALGTRAILTNVAATAVTAPTAAEGAEFCVVAGNGLTTNTVDFGAKSIIGPNGEVNGVLTLDAGPLYARFNSTLDKWVHL